MGEGRSDELSSGFGGRSAKGLPAGPGGRAQVAQRAGPRDRHGHGRSTREMPQPIIHHPRASIDSGKDERSQATATMGLFPKRRRTLGSAVMRATTGRSCVVGFCCFFCCTAGVAVRDDGGGGPSHHRECRFLRARCRPHSPACGHHHPTTRQSRPLATRMNPHDEPNHTGPFLSKQRPSPSHCLPHP